MYITEAINHFLIDNVNNIIKMINLV